MIGPTLPIGSSGCLHRRFTWIPKWEKQVSSKRRFPLLACSFWSRISHSISPAMSNDIQIPKRVGLDMAIFKTKRMHHWKSIHSDFRVFPWVLASMIYAISVVDSFRCSQGHVLLLDGLPSRNCRVMWETNSWVSWKFSRTENPGFLEGMKIQLSVDFLEHRDWFCTDFQWRSSGKIASIPLACTSPKVRIRNGTPPKTNLSMNNPPFEYVFPIENADVPLSC